MGGRERPGTYTLTIHPFVDPGETTRQAAVTRFNTAKSTLETAASTCASGVKAGCASAPEERGWLESVGAFVWSVVEGAVEACVELVTLPFKIMLAPLQDLFKLATGDLTPEELAMKYQLKVEMAQAMWNAMCEDPGEFFKTVGKALLDWDTWKDDPGRALGRLVPDLIIGILTAGTGTAATRGTAMIRNLMKAFPRLGSEVTALNRLTDLRALSALKLDNLGMTRLSNVIRGCSDPVDVATGGVFAPLLDVVLPGDLPLVLTRRYVSGYGLGRSFGPHWASVLDERVEVVGDQVVWARADGGLSSYPLPGPDGDEVLPLRGSSRWSLSSRGDGRFTIHDAVALQERHFLVDAEGFGWLVELTDQAGRWIRLGRDRTGRCADVTHHGGYHVVVVWDGPLVGGLTVDDGTHSYPLRGFAYDHDGNLVAEVDATGLDLRMEYDAAGRMTAWVDRNGYRYDYVYDEEGRCIAQGGTDRALRYTYDYSGHDPATGHRVTVAVDSLGHERRFITDGRGLLVAEVDPLGGVTEHGYDEAGNRTSTTDPTGATATWEYDARSRLVAETSPSGSVTRVIRDTNGLPVQTISPTGAVTLQQFDERGLLVAVTDATGGTSRLERDETGRVAAVVDAEGRRTLVTSDAAGLTVATTDPAGAVTTYRRDAFGRPLEVLDAEGDLTRMTWSTDGRLLTWAGPDGVAQLWEYDGEGNEIRHVDRAGRTRRTVYGGFDLPVMQELPDGSTLTYGYDTELRLTSVTNQLGHTWVYRRDALGRIVEEVDYDGRVTRVEFDAAGRQTASTNAAGQTVRRSYDAAGRPATVEADGEVVTYAYDAADDVVRVAGDIVVDYELDPVGRLVAESVDGRTVRHRYDASGALVGRVTPAGVESLWETDAVGLPGALGLGGHRTQIERDLLGREVSREVGSTAVASRWDPVGRLTARQVLDTKEGTAGLDMSLTYSRAGELVAMRDKGMGTSEFFLDSLSRVSAVRREAGDQEAYTYDAAGNVSGARWTIDAPVSGAPEVSANGHGRGVGRPGGSGPIGLGEPRAEAEGERSFRGTLVATAGRDRFDYDEAGRMVRRTRALLSGGSLEWTFAWDARDRLTRVTTPTRAQWEYRYDPLGRRVAKVRTVAGDRPGAVQRVDFVWSGPQLVEQTVVESSGGSTTTTWEHFLWEPIAQVRRSSDEGHADTVGERPPSGWSQERVDAEFAAIVTDMVGTPVALVDEVGDVVWRGRASLWGMPAGTGSAESRAAVMPLRFPGQYEDVESGLHYNLNRYYDPTTARYVTTDPLGLGAGPNARIYPERPHLFFDPLGLAGTCSILDVGNYRDMAARSIRDGLTPDHIPSFAAVRQFMRDNGVQGDISDSQLRRMTNTIMMDTLDHMRFSRTYGGRNSASQVAQDALDLRQAAVRDMDVWRPILEGRGYSTQQISDAFDNLHKLNEAMGLY